MVSTEEPVPKPEELAARLEALTGVCAQSAFVSEKASGKNIFFNRPVIILSPGGTRENATHIIDNILVFFRDAVGDEYNRSFTADHMGFKESIPGVGKINNKEGGTSTITVLDNQIIVTGRSDDKFSVIKAMEKRNLGKIIQEEIREELGNTPDLTKCHADAQKAAGDLKGSLQVSEAEHSTKTPDGVRITSEQIVRS